MDRRNKYIKYVSGILYDEHVPSHMDALYDIIERKFDVMDDLLEVTSILKKKKISKTRRLNCKKRMRN